MTAKNPVIEKARVEALADELRRGKEYKEDVGTIARDIQFGEAPGEGEMHLTSTAELIPLYNRATGECSLVVADQIKQKVSTRFPADHPTHAGQLVYTDAEMEPLNPGQLTCVLHPTHEQRTHFDALGFAGIICAKANIVTDFEVEQHLKLKHKTVWQTNERAITREREDRQMELMRQQTEAMQAVAASNATATPKRVTKEETANA